MIRTTWQIQTDDTTHTVSYTLNRLTGRMVVKVNEDEFTLSAGFLAMKAVRREPFRIVGTDGEAEQAVLVVDQKGRASLIFRKKMIAPVS